MIRTVVLHGELAKKYGERHELEIATPGEAIRAFCANYSDFEKFVSDSESRNVGYRVIIDDTDMPDVSLLHLPFSQSVHVVPVIGGAKSAFGGILVGALLIAGAVFFAPAVVGALGPTMGLGAEAFGVAGFSVSFGQIALFGASLVLGGVSQLLSPQPKTAAGATAQTDTASYLFNGPINTTAQGFPVPVGYGELIVGSSVISAGITADDYTATGLA
jgi:predicted phage tail protein